MRDARGQGRLERGLQRREIDVPELPHLPRRRVRDADEMDEGRSGRNAVRVRRGRERVAGNGLGSRGDAVFRSAPREREDAMAAREEGGDERGFPVPAAPVTKTVLDATPGNRIATRIAPVSPAFAPAGGRPSPGRTSFGGEFLP